MRAWKFTARLVRPEGRVGRFGVTPAWTGQTGDPAEALELFRALLPDQQRVLGPDHPDTLTTRHWIADLRQQIGEES